eukprot:TRINITY_DN17011_c0_g1_i1.p1 TRINITY_DN17011_c0_g1~~TRINITY_DN17011_c0_g1_i1.p1  ORF type:complete len:455 (+),score=75.72 TRINITY_DN17011_c0_g1_i1:87-1367(+)
MAHRVDLSSRCRKTQMCKFFVAHGCQRGASCSYAHSDAELRAIPDLRCTQICPELLAGKVCMASKCQFAHSAAERKKFPSAHSPSSRAAPAVAATKCAEPAMRPVSGSHGVADMAQDLMRLRRAQEAINHALASLQEHLRGSGRGTHGSIGNECNLSQQSTCSHVSAELLSELESDTKSASEARTVQWAMGLGLGCHDRADGQEPASNLGRQESQGQHGSGQHRADGSSRQISEGFGRQISEGFGRQVSDAFSCQVSSDFERQVSAQSELTVSEQNLGKVKTAFGSIFGRQVSDFGTVFGRQVSYSSPPDHNPEEDQNIYASLRVCVKNTFLTIEEDTQESTCSASWRSQSAPARCAQSDSVKKNKLDGRGFSSEDWKVGNELRKTKGEKQHRRGARKSVTLPGPLPVGQVAPAQPSPVLLGSAAK